MRRFVEGVDRSQTTLFPESLDDWVSDDNPVRVIDAFVEALELRALGFDGVLPEATGRPSDHPTVLLKLYIDGYLNRVQSSRRLEREAGRNVELMWLTGRLAPDHKTIATFRKDNGRAIRQVCAQFVTLCRKLGLLSTASVAIDGSKFKAVNNRDRNFTRAKVERRRAQIEESVARYLQQLDPADRHDPTDALAARTARLTEKMPLTARSTQRTMGYNVQVAVETKHHLIVAHEVTNDGCDLAQLSAMGKEAKAVLEVEELEAVADRGYWDREEIFACDQAGITVTLPKPMTSSATSKGRFGKQDFVYLPEEDASRCPAGEKLRYDYSTVERGLTLRRDWTTSCQSCPIKSRCSTGPQRRITRWEHEEVLEAVQRRLDLNPGAMRQRREVVEHPFGTIKLRMGAVHFLMKRLPKVRGEMALHVLAYNLTRVLNILGIQPLMAALRA